MVRIQIGVNFENESGERLFIRLYFSGFCNPTSGIRSDSYHSSVQILHPEIVAGRAEKHGSQITVTVKIFIERLKNTLNEFGIFAQLVGRLFPNLVVQLLVVEVGNGENLGSLFGFRIRKEEEFFIEEVENALELFSDADWP